jgi:hypothetical protein
MKDGALAFDKTGKHFIKTGSEPGAHSWRAESNVIAIEVVQPAGVDAKVWARMQNKKMYSLLQRGRMLGDDTIAALTARGITPRGADKGAVAEAVALLREFPQSGYCDALAWALRNVYFRPGYKLPAQLRDDICGVLGFSDARHLKDPGLGNFAFGIREDMFVAELLPLLSQYAKIPLDATEELKKQRIRLTPLEHTVRSAMRILSTEFRAGWWPHGDGYLLSPERPAAPK